MSVTAVCLGCWYKHEKTGRVAELRFASVPEEKDSCRLRGYTGQPGFWITWEGGWDQFCHEWSRVTKPEEAID